MALSEQRQKAFDFCADATKQLLTVATAVVTLTITFAKDFVVNVRPSAKIWAYLAWGGYLASIVCGVITLYALTAELEPTAPMHRPASIRKGASGWSFLQQLFFVVALILTVVFGVTATGASGGAKGGSDAKKVDTLAHRADSIYIFVCDTCCQPTKAGRRCTPTRTHVLVR